MQAQDDEITQLLKKIETQDDLIQKLRGEQTKLTSYINEFRSAIEKKLHKNQESTLKSPVDQEKIEKQLQKELSNAKLMLKNYQNQLKALQKKTSKNKFTADNLLEMQADIKKKEAYIRELNDDVKNLNLVKRKQEKLIEKKQKNEDGSKLSKIVEEIRKQKQILEGLKVKHQQKSQALEKRKLNIEEMEKQYHEKCKKYGEKPLIFQEYKDKRVQRKREESVNKFQKQPKRPMMTVKDIINSHLEMENMEISQKSLNQLTEKREVVQNSLKIAKKKYQKDIEQLQQRVDELKRENSSLNSKYLQKKKEKELIQTSKTINFKRNSSKTMKKLDPIK